jgi:cation transporter-like permease
MRLNQPRLITWIVALVIAIIAVLVYQFIKIDNVTDKSFWIAMLAWLVLAVATVVKGR